MGGMRRAVYGNGIFAGKSDRRSGDADSNLCTSGTSGYNTYGIFLY